jgi:hypothetical protein
VAEEQEQVILLLKMVAQVVDLLEIKVQQILQDLLHKERLTVELVTETLVE